MLTLRRIASVLLLMCVVLPLSKCGGVVEIDGHTSSPDTFLYPYAMVVDALANINTGRVSDGLVTLIAIFSVFGVPAACLKTSQKVRIALTFAGGFVAAYLLYQWVFVFGKPQIGGLIATVCWIVLLGLAIVELYGRRRNLRFS